MNFTEWLYLVEGLVGSICLITLLKNFGIKLTFLPVIVILSLILGDAFYYIIVYRQKMGSASTQIFNYTVLPFTFFFSTSAIFGFKKFQLREKLNRLILADYLTLVLLLFLFAAYFFVPWIAAQPGRRMEISSYTGFLTVLISLPALLTAHLIVSKSDESINLIWGFSLLTLVFLNLLIEATNLREGNLLFSHFDVLWFIAAVTLFIFTFFLLKRSPSLLEVASLRP